MKIKFKNFIKFIIYLPIDILLSISLFYSNLLSRVTRKLYLEDKIENKKKKYLTIKIKENIYLKFYTVNTITKFRAETFFDKEPDTIKWIDEYNGQGNFLDIGANIGIYSNFFAKTKKGSVYAFESSFYNLSILAENCQINKNEKKITIFPLPLFKKNSVDFFKINNPIIGGALSSFGVDYGHDGNKIENFREYKIPSFNLDFLIDNKIINEVPALVKIDVDGVEDLILKGSNNMLKDNKCNSVLVEVNEKFNSQFENIQKIMFDNGFRIISSGKKTKVKELSINANFQKTYNQIWIKD